MSAWLHDKRKKLAYTLAFFAFVSALAGMVLGSNNLQKSIKEDNKNIVCQVEKGGQVYSGVHFDELLISEFRGKLIVTNALGKAVYIDPPFTLTCNPTSSK